MKFLSMLFVLIVAMVAADAQAGCQQQVLALRQFQLQPVQVYGQQQLNSGCYVQQIQQVQQLHHVQQVRVQQLNQHHGQQLLVVRPQRQQVIIQRQALFPRLFGR